MHPLLGSKLSRHTRHLLVWAVLLVTCCVLPRALVVCSGPHCESRIEFVHAGGACCDHAREPVDACAGQHHGECDDDGEHPTKHSRCGCTDVPIAIDEVPLPQRVTLTLGHPPALLEIEPPPTIATRDDLQFELPPATGPPRVDRRTELRRTTVLLI